MFANMEAYSTYLIKMNFTNYTHSIGVIFIILTLPIHITYVLGSAGEIKPMSYAMKSRIICFFFTFT